MEWAASGKRMKVLCFTFSLHYLHIQSYRNIKSLRGKERAVTLSLEVQSEGAGGDHLGKDSTRVKHKRLLLAACHRVPVRRWVSGFLLWIIGSVIIFDCQ